jgi:hypothetical protein
MQQAHQMLRETTLTVKEVVSAILMSDRRGFSREFKITSPSLESG